VTLKGNGRNDLLVNALGHYSGLTLVPSLAVGSYERVLTADPAPTSFWGGELERLQAPSPTRPLAGAYSKTGDWVYQVHANKQSQPTVSGVCACIISVAVTGDQLPTSGKCSWVGDQSLFSLTGAK
jgi:hypothetical protein